MSNLTKSDDPDYYHAEEIRPKKSKHKICSYDYCIYCDGTTPSYFKKRLSVLSLPVIIAFAFVCLPLFPLGFLIRHRSECCTYCKRYKKPWLETARDGIDRLTIGI